MGKNIEIGENMEKGLIIKYRNTRGQTCFAYESTSLRLNRSSYVFNPRLADTDFHDFFSFPQRKHVGHIFLFYGCVEAPFLAPLCVVNRH